MKKPTEIELWLVRSSPIHTVHVSYDMTGVDTADTNVTLTGSQGTRKFKKHTLQGLGGMCLGYNSVFEPSRRVVEDVKAWTDFEKQNASDLAEFARLKEKLGL